MAKIKHTKTELKAQTDALKRFQRFLPMLQLKKQQLQAEIAGITAKLGEVQKREAEARKRLDAWIALYADAEVAPDALVTFKGVRTAQGNIAGVGIPLYEGIDAEPAPLDPYRTPAWTDDAQAMLAELMALKAQIARWLLAAPRSLVPISLSRSVSPQATIIAVEPKQLAIVCAQL